MTRPFALPIWWQLHQDVCQQHLLCTSEEEVVAKAVALIDERVSDVLVCCSRNGSLGSVASGLLAVAFRNFLRGERDRSYPDGFDRSRYSRPVWSERGVWTTYDRLRYWADRGERFRDRPAAAACV